MTVSGEDRELARVEAATAWVHKRWDRYAFKDRDELVAMKALDVIEVADSPWMRAMIDALVENAYWGPRPAVSKREIERHIFHAITTFGYAIAGSDFTAIVSAAVGAVVAAGIEVIS